MLLQPTRNKQKRISKMGACCTGCRWSVWSRIYYLIWASLLTVFNTVSDYWQYPQNRAIGTCLRNSSGAFLTLGMWIFGFPLGFLVSIHSPKTCARWVNMCMTSNGLASYPGEFLFNIQSSCDRHCTDCSTDQDVDWMILCPFIESVYFCLILTSLYIQSF